MRVRILRLGARLGLGPLPHFLDQREPGGFPGLDAIGVDRLRNQAIAQRNDAVVLAQVKPRVLDRIGGRSGRRGLDIDPPGERAEQLFEILEPTA